MKLCFSTLGCHDLCFNDILMLASEYNVEAIEVRGINNEMDNEKIYDFSLEQMNVTIQKMNDFNIVPYSLGTSCSFHDKDKYDKSIEKCLREIDVASRMKFKNIRVFGNKITEDKDECYKRVVNGLKIVSDYASNKNVTVLLEVHGDYNTVENLKPIIDELGNHSHFGLIWDIYHTHKPYKENWMMFYEQMKDYIHHVHIKDAQDELLVLPGEGNIEMKNIIRHLINDGYDGYFSLEWERKWNPDLPELNVALKYLSKMMEDI